jgi:hypothetical protein
VLFRGVGKMVCHGRAGVRAIRQANGIMRGFAFTVATISSWACQSRSDREITGVGFICPPNKISPDDEYRLEI